MDDTTGNYYLDPEYAMKTRDISMASAIVKFYKHLTGKNILDADCGSGRDSKQFFK